MATYYWVGGAGTWDSTSTTRWSTSSGGSGGAGPPTSADDVIFDAASDTGANFTVTLGSTLIAVCKNLTFTAPDVTITMGGTTATRNIDIHGNLSSATNAAWSAGVVLRFRGGVAQDITSNGDTISVGTIQVQNGSTVTLQDNTVTSTGTTTLNLVEGTFDTNDKNFTVAQILSNGALTRTLDLGSSAVTLDFNNNIVLQFSGSNFTFNEGTSTITVASEGSIFFGGGETFYNLTFSSGSTNSFLMDGANTFNNFTITGPTSAENIGTYNFTGNQTINGTLTVSGTAKNERIIIRGMNVSTVSGATNSISGEPLTSGTRRTLTVAAVSGMADIDFQSINFAGVASPLTGTRLGDAGNNNGITFDAPKTLYWNLGGGTLRWYTDNGWATTSGGTPSSANFPLCQDTMVVNDDSTMPTNLEIGSNSSTELYFLPAFDCSARTTACSIDFEAGGRWVGNVSLSNDPDVTYATSSPVWSFNATGRDVTLTTNGRALPEAISFRPEMGSTNSIILGGDVTFTGYSTGASILFVSGIFDLNEYEFNYRTMSGGASANDLNNRTLDFGAAGELICKDSSTSTCSLLLVGSNTNFSCTGSRTIRYQGTKASGALETRTDDLSSFTSGNACDVYIETGSAITWSFAFGVRSLNTQGYTGTQAFGDDRIWGSLTIGTGHSPALDNNICTFFGYDYGSGPQSFTPNGKNLNCAVTFNFQSPTGGMTLQGDMILGTSSLNGVITALGSGTLDSNDYNISFHSFDGDGATAFVWNMGSGTATLAGTGIIWDTSPSTGITINGETSTILSSDTTNTARTLQFGTSQTVHNIVIGGGSSTAIFNIRYTTGLTLTGTLSETRSGAAYSIRFESSTTPPTFTCAGFNINGTSGNLITLAREGASGTFALAKSGGGVINTVDFVSISNSTATPGSTWYAGANSTNGGGNTGWIFTAAPPQATGNFFQLFFP